MIRTLLEILIFVVLVSIIVIDDSSGHYYRGYREGQLDAVEDRLTREAWNFYGNKQDEVYRLASEKAQQQYKDEFATMVEQAIDRAVRARN